MTEAEIQSTADSLIKTYGGTKAAMEATKMAVKMLAREDIIGHQTWTQVGRIIHSLRARGDAL